MIKKGIGSIWGKLAALVFAFIIGINVLLVRKKQYWMYYDLLLPNWVLLLADVILVAILAVAWSKKTGKDNVRKMHMVLALQSALLFLLQMILVKSICCELGWDVSYIKESAQQYVSGGLSQEYQTYFANNPNNIMILWLTVIFLRIGRLFSIDGYGLMIMVGILLVNTAVGMCALCVYQMTHRASMAYGTHLLGALLFGLSPWIMVPYTDVFSVWIPIASVFIYSKVSKSHLPLVGKVFLVVALPCLGYLLKPTNLFVLLAILVHFLWSSIKSEERVKRCGKIILGVAMSVLLIFAARQFVYHTLGYQENEAGVKPMEHYLLLGSNYNMVGMFNWQDDDYTDSFVGVSAKKQADLMLVKQRYQEMGLIGWFHHICNKTYLNYSNGIFGWGKEDDFVMQTSAPDNKVASFLQNLYYVGGNRLLREEQSFGVGGEWFAVYTTLAQMLWLFVLLLCLVAAVLSHHTKEECILSITLLGVFVFLTVFETNARYLFSFLPIFVMMAMSGFYRLCECFKIYHKTRCI